MYEKTFYNFVKIVEKNSLLLISNILKISIKPLECILGKVFNLPLEEDNNLSWDVMCVFLIIKTYFKSGDLYLFYIDKILHL